MLYLLLQLEADEELNLIGSEDNNVAFELYEVSGLVTILNCLGVQVQKKFGCVNIKIINR